MRKNLRFLAGFALAAVLLYFFFRSVNFADTIHQLGRADWLFVVLSCAAFPLTMVVRALRWRYLVCHRKDGLRFRSLFSATVVGFATSMVLPGRVGEVVRPLYLARKEDLPAGFCIGTVLVERIFDIFVMCSLLGIFLLAGPLYPSSYAARAEGMRHLYLWGKVGVVLGVVLLGLILSMYFFKEKTLRVFAVLFRPLPERVRGKALNLVGELIEGLKFFHSGRNLLLYVVFSFGVWLAITFYYWVFFISFRVSLPFFLLIPFVFLTGVGASIPTPGMAGGFDVFAKIGLTTLYGIPGDLATGAVLVTHGLQVTMTCLMGYAILWKERLSLFQLKSMGEIKAP